MRHLSQIMYIHILKIARSINSANIFLTLLYIKLVSDCFSERHIFFYEDKKQKYVCMTDF